MILRSSEHGPFSSLIRSRSSSISSSDVPGANSSEVTAAKVESDPRNSSDDVDDNLDLDILFDQFLYFSSPVFSPDSTDSGISESTLIDTKRN